MNNPMWNAILRWSVQQSDGTRPSDLQVMSDEDKKFLENAFEALVVDQVKQMIVLVDSIKVPEDPVAIRQTWELVQQAAKQPRPEKEEWRDQGKYQPPAKFEVKEDMTDEELVAMVVHQKAAALDMMDELVLTIDNANNLHKVNGLVPLLASLDSASTQIVWRATQVVATLTQNNPEAQKLCLERGVEAKLAAVLRRVLDRPEGKGDEAEESDWNMASFKAVGAVSSFVRGFPAGLIAFAEQGGLQLLIRVFNSPRIDTRTKKKALNLLCWLMDQHEGFVKLALDAGIVEGALACVGHKDIDLREIALKTLCQFPAAEVARYDARNIFTERYKTLKALVDPSDIEQVSDEVELLRELLKRLMSLPVAPVAAN